jgi:hypothetical protein
VSYCSASPRGSVAFQGSTYGGQLRVPSVVVRAAPLLASPPALASRSLDAPASALKRIAKIGSWWVRGDGGVRRPYHLRPAGGHAPTPPLPPEP